VSSRGVGVRQIPGTAASWPGPLSVVASWVLVGDVRVSFRLVLLPVPAWILRCTVRGSRQLAPFGCAVLTLDSWERAWSMDCAG